jgi:hypothetical protein
MSESSVRNLLSTTGGTTGWTGANDFSYSFGLNSWNHMMYVWDGSTGKTYINGVLANTSTVTGSIVSTTYSLRIGNYNSTAYFPGKIQDVRIYDR